MKRLFVIASMAIMVVGCQKTTIENEVLTPIGFSTDVAKQTRAVITDGEDYDIAVPFAVYSYGYQISGTDKVTGSESTPMKNVKITRQEVPDTDPVTYVWKAASGTYYWPNDADTRLDFYAYSPAVDSGITHDITNGFKVTYTQATTNPYVDFMVSEPVTGAYYDNQDGGDESVKGTVVPIKFKHQLTQVVFKVTSTITGVKATINSIVLKNVGTVADYTENKKKTVDGEEVSAPWDPATAPGTYTILSSAVAAKTSTVDYGSTTVETVPVALIPQGLEGLTFDIEYSLEGTGVATETVLKEGVSLKVGALTEWTPNKKVIYNLSIGLKEITFAPEVENWDGTVEGNIDIE